jgi:hypothetical protein
MTRRSGFSLLDIVMGISILSMVILFVVSLLPSSVGSLRRAEALQGATLYGTELLEAARAAPPGTPVDTVVTLNSTSMHVTREILPLGNRLVDVKVTVTYRPDAQPVLLTTRLPASASPLPMP